MALLTTSALISAALVYIGLYLTFVTLVAYWVYKDARARGSNNEGLWAVAVMVFMFLILPYLWLRDEREKPLSKRERQDTVLVLSMGVALFGSMMVSPLSPFIQLGYFMIIFLGVTPVVYIIMFKTRLAVTPF